jgi:hypothetical protein
MEALRALSGSLQFCTLEYAIAAHDYLHLERL